MAKEIISVVKQGGPDPRTNARLRAIIQKAKAANFPTENIERNIKKASSTDQADFHELTYEIYGHGGVGIVVEAMTDNKNRTASDMRIATNKKGGSIASPGSVTYNFERRGVIRIAGDRPEEEVFAHVIEAGADDFEATDGTYVVTVAPDALEEVRGHLTSAGVVCREVAVEMVPVTTVECDEKAGKANLALIDFLEDLGDVDAVFHNMA